MPHSWLSRLMPSLDPAARGHVIAALAVAAITSVGFAPTLVLDYTKMDDGIYVSENPRVQQGLTFDNVRWALTTTTGEYWHPITWLSFLVDSGLFGTSPSAMHRTSLILHSANATLLCLIFGVSGAPPAVAAACASLFALHPMRVESVAWIAERKGLLCAFFILLAVLVYISEEDRRRRAALLAACFALAIMSKPTAVVLPALLLCVDFWPLDRWHRDGPLKCLVEKWPLWLMASLDAAMTLRTEHRNISALRFIPIGNRIKIGLIGLGTYLRKTIAPPWRESWISFMGVDPTVPIPLLTAGLSLAILTAMTIGVITARRRAPWLLAGWFWFLFALLPTLGFVRFTPGASGDRFTYLAHLGFALGFNGSAIWAWSHWTRARRAMSIATGLVVALFITITWNNIWPWRDMGSLAARIEEVDPKNSWAYNSLGVELASARKLDAALNQLDTAIALRPDYFQAWNNRGVTLAYLGRYDESIASFDRSLSLVEDRRLIYNRETVKMVRAHPDYRGAPLKLILIHGVDLGKNQP